MYLAPEVLAGSAFTVKSDIYSLVFVLYEMLAGDFHRTMSTGWEREISDELLREDIVLLSDGNAGERLGDAEIAGRRLRSLEERRAQLRMLRETQARSERTKRLLERARARRFGLSLALVAMCLGTAVSSVLYSQGLPCSKTGRSSRCSGEGRNRVP